MSPLSEKILKLHDKGFGRAVIADQLGVTEWRVRTVVRANITERLQAKEYNPKTKQRIRYREVKSTQAGTKRAVVLSDIHIPFHDQKALGIALSFMLDYKPHVIVLNGDIIDFYGASSYRQDPHRIDTLQDEISETIAFLELLRDMFPAAEMHYVQGNHEHRLERFILDKCPQLYSLEFLALDEILQLERLNIRWVAHHAVVRLGELEITHGSMVRNKAGYSARAHLDKTGGSVLLGHTHRQGIVSLTNRYGVHTAIENGYLARETVDYAWRPDWQKGFTTVEYEPSGKYFAPRLHSIKNDKLVVDGRCYQV